MRDTKELYSDFASMIRNLREDESMSRAKFANRLGIDEHTLARWETGKSAPNVIEFIQMYELFSARANKRLLNFVSPEIYEPIVPDASDAEIKQALIHFISNFLSNRGARMLAYILFGEHGSSVEAQLDMITALDHLPLDCRLAVAKLALNFWEIATFRDDIINKENVMPDAENLRKAIIASQQAIKDGKSRYMSR